MAWTHLVHLNPLPANLGEVLRRYPKILVPELNMGQLSKVVRAEYLVDATSLSKVQGLPFTATEIDAAIAGGPGMTDTDRSPSPRRRTGPATRRCAGARAAATTASCSPSRCSCPS